MDDHATASSSEPCASHLDASAPSGLRTIVIDYHGTLTADIDAPAHGEAPVTARAASAIRELAAEYRLVLASNTRPDEHRVQVLEQAGIREHFAALVLSHLLDTRKPEPAFFEHVQLTARCPPEQILYVGDHMAHDVIPAARHGMHTALIRRRGPRPGDQQRLPAGGRILTHFGDVPALARELACAS